MKTLTKQHLKFLKNVQKLGFKSAIIAGGAVRDDYFGIEPSDIDIYLHHPTHSKEAIRSDFYIGTAKLRDLFKDFYPDAEIKVSCCVDESYVGKLEFLEKVWNVDVDGVMYQLIFTKIPPQKVVMKYFDTGICMAFCDGTRLRYTSRFTTDVKNKTITICGKMTRRELDRSMIHHIPKIEAKFPDYKVIIDPELEKKLGLIP